MLASLERGAGSGKDDWGGNLLMLEVDRAAGTVAVGNDLDADWEVVMSFESFRTVARTHAAAMTLRQGGHTRISPGYAESLRTAGGVNVDDLERMGFRVTRCDEDPPPTT
ncbi:hypothetical protein GCM10027596_04900 [Nocardioides korecus]